MAAPVYRTALSGRHPPPAARRPPDRSNCSAARNRSGGDLSCGGHGCGVDPGGAPPHPPRFPSMRAIASQRYLHSRAARSGRRAGPAGGTRAANPSACLPPHPSIGLARAPGTLESAQADGCGCRAASPSGCRRAPAAAAAAALLHTAAPTSSSSTAAAPFQCISATIYSTHTLLAKLSPFPPIRLPSHWTRCAG